jgi:hypothetical protein
MSKEKMIAQVEAGDDSSADLIADLIECLLDPDNDESNTTDGHFAYLLNTVDEMNH